MWVLLVVVSVLAWTVVDSLRLMHCSSLCKARTTSSVRWHTTAMAALRNDNDRDDDSVKKTGGRGDGWKTLVRQFDDGASGNGRRSKAGGSSKYRASSSARRPTASSEMFPSGASSSSSSSGGSNSHSKVALVKRAVTSGVVPISAGGVPASKLAIAKALNIKDELQCSHFDTCSGCTIAGNFTSAGLMQRASKFFKLYNLQMKTHVDAVKHWRSHVKLAVQPMSKWGGMKIGLYHANSHTVEAIPHCQVHHPRINEAVELLRLTALDCGVKAYQEPANNRGRGNGELRYVQLSMERRSNKVQLVLVWNADHYKDCSQALGRLVKKLKSQPIWHSITINFNTGSSNVIFNYEEDGWKLLHGPSFIKERVGNATFLFRPQIFRQVQ